MGRAPCCDKANVKRGPWSPDEDAILKSYIENHGTGGNWISLPQKAGLKRCGKSCRLRWLNYLRPDIKHGCFTEEEDNIICSLYFTVGSRWSVMASNLPGRTDNDIKNYWNTRLKKKLLAGKTHFDTSTVANINPNSSTSCNIDSYKNHSSCLISNQTSTTQPQYRPHLSYSQPDICSSGSSLPSLTEVSDNSTSNIAHGNTEFQNSSSHELSSSSFGSSPWMMTEQFYSGPSIDDLLDLDFEAIHDILSNGFGLEQVTSSVVGPPYMI